LQLGGATGIHYPIQFFDVLFALQVMTDLGRLGDPRCADALALLEQNAYPTADSRWRRSPRSPQTRW
jgi:hypothetical protein